jgi:hypothetical protein
MLGSESPIENLRDSTRDAGDLWLLKQIIMSEWFVIETKKNQMIGLMRVYYARSMYR